MLEVLQRLQPFDVGLRRRDQSILGRRVADFFVNRLLRHRLRRQQRFPSLRGQISKRCIGLDAGQITLRLSQLLVEIGRIDHRELFARLHLCTDIFVPQLQVAGHPSIDRCLIVSLHVARQDQFLILGAGLGATR